MFSCCLDTALAKINEKEEEQNLSVWIHLSLLLEICKNTLSQDIQTKEETVKELNKTCYIIQQIVSQN
jgi:hypothetical protein